MENEEMIVTETEAAVEVAKTNGKDLLKGGLIGAGILTGAYAVGRWVVKPLIKKFKAKKASKSEVEKDLGTIEEVTESEE